MRTSFTSLHQRQTFLKILVFSFVTAVVWVGYSLFQSQQKTGIEPDLLRLARPLNPNIDLSVIDTIEHKRRLNQADLQNFVIYKIVRSRTGEETITTEPIEQATARLNELLITSATTAAILQRGGETTALASPSPLPSPSLVPSPTATSSSKTATSSGARR